MKGYDQNGDNYTSVFYTNHINVCSGSVYFTEHFHELFIFYLIMHLVIISPLCCYAFFIHVHFAMVFWLFVFVVFVWLVCVCVYVCYSVMLLLLLLLLLMLLFCCFRGCL